MPNIRQPRMGSMQYWPRKQTKRRVARVRSWADIRDLKPIGFAGYKVGMTHIIMTDNRQASLTKGEGISCPVTIIECPPLKAASIRFYKNTPQGLKLVSEIFSEKLDKELERAIVMPKKIKKKIEDIKDFDDIRLLVYTQPGLTTIGKKKPELFELALGGKKEEKLNYAKEKLGKELIIKDVFGEGQQVDTHTITKGKGFQGPVKRFGISIRRHKSEKSIRNPGSLGAWCGQVHFMYRVAHAGRMGYNIRTEYNKLLLKISDKPDINPKSGFYHYGVIKNPYILVKGSVPGPAKRLVRLNHATRPNKNMPGTAPLIQYINLK